MIDYYLAGALLRGSQILVDSAIWIAFGCFIAAIFRNMVGAEKTRALFGNDSKFGLLIGWAIGMLLPVCSLGVIPVVREMQRVGVKSGTIIAFGLTAPLFNPLSILYGLSLSDPLAIIVFSAAAMVIVTAMGAIWGKVFDRKESQDPSGDESVPTTGTRRSIAVIHDGTTAMVGWAGVFMLIGFGVSTLIATFVPHGYLQAQTEPDKMFAPVVMAGYVTPVYSTPLLAMSQIGGMFQHGNSIGAAFSLLVLGAGVNVGFLFWFSSAFGLRKAILFLLLLWALTISIAYTLDKPLYPKGVSPSGHTHAFDIYTHPYHRTDSELVEKAALQSKQYLQDRGFGAPYFLAGMVIVGFVFRVLERKWDLRAWYTREQAAKEGWDIELPTWVIGAVACVCLVLVSIAGTFMYYPHPNATLDILKDINVNCVLAARQRDWEAVEKWVPYCDDLSRRLEVGVFLREGSISDFKRAKARVYRELLDEMRDNIQVGQTANIGELAIDVNNAYREMSNAFRVRSE